MSEAKDHSQEITPAIEGWYTLDREQPHLVGARCDDCGTYYFPKTVSYCRNPDCDSEQFAETLLSRTGTIWSYTDASYAPPAPFPAQDPFEPFAIAAVELAKEKMIVMGQVATGIGPSQLHIGDPVELILEPHERTEGDLRWVWKWRPCATEAAS